MRKQLLLLRFERNLLLVVFSDEPTHQKYRNNAVAVMSWRKNQAQKLDWKKLTDATSFCDEINVWEEADFVSVLIADQINLKGFYRSRCWPIHIQRQQQKKLKAHPVPPTKKLKAPYLTSKSRSWDQGQFLSFPCGTLMFLNWVSYRTMCSSSAANY